MQTAFAILVVGWVGGVDHIGFDTDGLKVNPDCEECVVLGKGIYAVGPAHELVKIELWSRHPNGQESWIPTSTNKENWSAKLRLVESEYQVWAEIHTRDKSTGAVLVGKTLPVKVKVAKPVKL
jgi:hypothetical protein